MHSRFIHSTVPYLHFLCSFSSSPSIIPSNVALTGDYVSLRSEPFSLWTYILLELRMSFSSVL